MSVVVTIRVKGDPAMVEATPDEVFAGLRERAMAQGATYHRFFGSDDEVLVVDEWPDVETFQKFFASETEVAALLQRAARGEPEISFWRHLDVNDDIG